MKGDLKVEFKKKGKKTFRKLNPDRNYTSPKGSVSATDNIIIKDSNLEFGDLEIDGLNVDIVASEISGLNYINIKSIGSINIADESSIMSSFSESGNVKLSGGNVFIHNSSRLAGSSKVEIEATENVEVSGKSHFEIGWKDAPNIENSLEWMEILWDSQTGQIVDNHNYSPTQNVKSKKSVLDFIKQNYSNNWATMNIVDVNKPNFEEYNNILINSNVTLINQLQ